MAVAVAVVAATAVVPVAVASAVAVFTRRRARPPVGVLHAALSLCLRLVVLFRWRVCPLQPLLLLLFLRGGGDGGGGCGCLCRRHCLYFGWFRFCCRCHRCWRCRRSRKAVEVVEEPVGKGVDVARVETAPARAAEALPDAGERRAGQLLARVLEQAHDELCGRVDRARIRLEQVLRDERVQPRGLAPVPQCRDLPRAPAHRRPRAVTHSHEKHASKKRTEKEHRKSVQKRRERKKREEERERERN